jgi:glutaredoxin
LSKSNARKEAFETSPRAQLLVWVRAVSRERHAPGQKPPQPWFYACVSYAFAVQPKPARLVLYQYPTCPFCIRVKAAARDLGVDLELKNIHADRQAWQELVEAMGRQTVPVLRIYTADGKERWMPESRAIIGYLNTLEK